ncbi:MAG: hypothetical protein DWQ07_17345 [Chloroflexi bacterium]|nr:MAG: hypothetical protein DWQ07_17345 [Chloroflexota bacterium]MBL1195171.1 hypothetical protein [Chloroflexota bacterium]
MTIRKGQALEIHIAGQPVGRLQISQGFRLSEFALARDLRSLKICFMQSLMPNGIGGPGLESLSQRTRLSAAPTPHRHCSYRMVSHERTRWVCCTRIYCLAVGLDNGGLHLLLLFSGIEYYAGLSPAVQSCFYGEKGLKLRWKYGYAQ